MAVSLDRFADVIIRRATRTVSSRGFGNVMIASYLTWFPERVRTYEDPDDMLDDGCPETAPEYLAAVALCSQEERPNFFKIGRRAGAPVQTIRLTPSTPVAGEVFTLSAGGVPFSVTAADGDAVADVIDDIVLLLGAD